MTTSLRDYVAKLQGISDGSLTNAIAREVATEGLQLIDAGFSTETDPYGVPWRPLKPPVRKSGAGIEDDTGTMRRSFFAIPSGTQVRFINPRPQANAQNYGRAEINLPSRMMLPSSERGLGPKWTAMVERAAGRIAREALKP